MFPFPIHINVESMIQAIWILFLSDRMLIQLLLQKIFSKDFFRNSKSVLNKFSISRTELKLSIIILNFYAVPTPVIMSK